MHFHHPLLQVKHLFNLFILLVSLLSTMTSSAHEIRPSIVDISFTKNGSYKMSIKTNLEAMLAEIGAEHTDTSNSNNAQRYNNLRKMPFDTLIQEFSTFEANLIEKIQLNFNGSPQKISVESVDIPDIGDIELARDSTINFVGTMPDNTINLSWKWDASFGNAILRVSSDKQPELYSNYLTGGELSIRIPVSGIKAPSKWEQFKNYIQIGFVHIIPKGLDHILFVIGLFLLSTQLRPLLIQITSFTLAHSVTLALGIYGIVNISSAIVEPLIAASIIYVAIENIYADKLSRLRPLIIFIFGLLHGLGFASVLQDIGLTSSNFVTGLIAFNIGVEIGQLTVIAVCFLLIGFWFRHKKWYRRVITIPASIVIAIIASYWLIERTLLA